MCRKSFINLAKGDGSDLLPTLTASIHYMEGKKPKFRITLDFKKKTLKTFK